MTCTFFGHHDTPSTILPALRNTIRRAVTEYGVDYFLVGNQGHFDGMVLEVLRKAKNKHPHINYNVVLAYMPGEKEEWNPYNYGETMLPEGIEGIHPKYAISWRNKWMVNESDIVVAYITHSWGGAAKYVGMATKRGKNVINLGL